MMSLETWLAFVTTCIVLIAIPGPNVTLIIANSMRHGVRAGIATVLGTSLGTFLLLVGLIIGISPVIAFAAEWFFWVKLVGAVYLIYLGFQMLRSTGEIQAPKQQSGLAKHPFLQGFLVLLANPKILLFLGAFVPQFVDHSGNVILQMTVLSATLLTIAITIDGTYALLAGKSGSYLGAQRTRLLNRLGGSFLIAGGVWMALARK